MSTLKVNLRTDRKLPMYCKLRNGFASMENNNNMTSNMRSKSPPHRGEIDDRYLSDLTSIAHICCHSVMCSSGKHHHDEQ